MQVAVDTLNTLTELVYKQERVRCSGCSELAIMCDVIAVYQKSVSRPLDHSICMYGKHDVQYYTIVPSLSTYI